MCKVLIIDDDPAVREIIVSMLQEWSGADVTCASDSMAGVEKLRAVKFDLALIDGALAGMSGIQLAGVAAAENTPALILSGHPDVNRTAAAFGFPYLAKPFSVSELLTRSRDAVANAHHHVARVKASASRLQLSIDEAKVTMAHSRALLAALRGP